ncbi:hypothetical protein QU39_00315, partial [Staphylococcus aureus]
EAHAERQRDQRGAAVGDEGERHALGRHQLRVHRHVDAGLQSEERGEPGDGESREGVVGAARQLQSAHHDEGEQRHEAEADDHAELLAGDGEDEVGMRVRQVALGDALAGTGAEPASGAERFARPELLEAVAGVAVEEAADALADMVQERIGHE